MIYMCAAVSLQALTSREPHNSTLRSRTPLVSIGDTSLEGCREEVQPLGTKANQPSPSTSWRRVLLLIIAITIHNIPGDYSVCIVSEI